MLFLGLTGTHLGGAVDNAQDGDAKALEARIDKLLNELEDQHFQTRQRAMEDLTKIGAPALLTLNKKLAEKPALDVKVRIERIIETIELRQAPEFQLHGEWQIGSAFFVVSPGGKWLAAARRVYDVDRKLELKLGDKTAQAIPAFGVGEGYWAYSEEPEDGQIGIRLYDRQRAKEIRKTISGNRLLKHGAWVRAVSPTGRYVVMASFAERSASLIDLTTGKEVTTFQDFEAPYHGDFRANALRVRFTPDEKYLLFHSRPADRGGGADYQLVVWDIEKSQRRASLPAWVSWETDRFAVSSDGAFVVNGDYHYDVTRLELAEGKKTVLFNCREELSSHWLELLLSPNNRMLAVWSSERRPIIFFDLASQQRFQIERKRSGSFRQEMLAFSRDGRHAFLARDRGVDVVDLKHRKVARSFEVEAGDHDMQMTRDGACLVIKQTPKDESAPKLRIFKQKP